MLCVLCVLWLAGSVGMARLNTLVANLMLRRSKEEVKDQLCLTQKIVQTHNIDLHHDEKEIYQVFFQEAQ